MERSERERYFHDEVDIQGRHKKFRDRFWHVHESPNTRRWDLYFAGLLRAAVPGRQVLEIGCGTGRLCQRVAEMGAAEVHGIELSRRALEGARPRESAALCFFEHDAHSPLDGRYDVIFGKAVLHHLNYREVLPRLYQDNLRPGGEMMFFEPLGGNLLMKLYWRLGSSIHTPDERPFLEDDLRWLSATFPSFEMKPVNYTTIPVGVVSSFLSSDPQNWVLSMCDRIDSLLAEKVAFLQAHFRSGIFHIRKGAPAS